MAKSSKALAKAKDGLAAARAKAKAAISKVKKDDPTVCHSFLPGTKVLLVNGITKSIDKVALGDKVVATDPATGRTTTREVVGTIVTEDDKHFVDLTIKAKSGGAAALIATTTHPFWVKSANAWIDAGDLKPGMTLREADGSTATVEGVRHFDKRQRTHDLTVSGIHSYYVVAGAAPVLVHNCSEVAVDTNAVTDALSGAKTAEVDTVLADGRQYFHLQPIESSLKAGIQRRVYPVGSQREVGEWALGQLRKVWLVFKEGCGRCGRANPSTL